MSGKGDAAPILKPIWVSDRQKRLLDLILEGVNNLDEISGVIGTRREDLMRDVEELRAKGLLRIEKKTKFLYVLTDEGRRYVTIGLPEERVLEIVIRGPIKRQQILEKGKELGVDLTKHEAGIGVNQLARMKALKFEGDVILPLQEKYSEALTTIRSLREALVNIDKGKPIEEEMLKQLKRRKLIEVRQRVLITIEPTAKLRELYSRGLVSTGLVITKLTPEIIESGGWKKAVFKEYDLSVEPPTIFPGKRHPYLEFLDWVREILVSMGFEEMKGPHVELELWNFDALFQAQDHPAREIHDTYFVKNPREGVFDDKALLERIGRTHEDGWVTGSRGWGYRWDPRRALRLVLRTQTTAVSMRTIYGRGEGEYMCFSLDRVFRPENLDAKHSMEFYQLEGIIVGKNVTFKHLLGFFNEIARRLGLGKVKVKPAYFPFTEPSVEGFIKHPRLGWIEVFPGGMFRPEVTRPLGIKEANVAAWGIGIDRIAMSVLGIDDIRLLFSQDIDFLRKAPRPLPARMVR